MAKGFLRLFAVLLLALTIPVQGMAAVMAAQCMAAGHHHQGSGPDSHAHDQTGANGHDQHSHSDAGNAGQDDDAKQSHCGPCAACCASASIAGPVGHPLLSSPSNTKYVFSKSLPPGVQPHGLDRPPLAL